MSVALGTYVIVSALDTGYALDVQGGSDGQGGRRVQLHQRNDTDAQIVRVVQDGDSQKLVFLLSGMALDRINGATANGTPLQQWNAGPGNAAQQWDVEPDGESVEVGGSSVPTYTVAAHDAPGQVVDVTNAVISNGTGLQMYEANGTNAQRWAFVPQPAVPDGTWVVHSALESSLVLDVSGNSQADGANVQVYSENGTNAQSWATSTSDGVTTIRNAQSGKALDVQNADPANGANVQVYSPNGTQAQQWVAEPAEQVVEVNGSVVPLYVVHAVNSTGKVLDVAGGGTQVGTNVQVYDANGTASQRFWFEPTEYLAGSLPVPSGGGVSETRGEASQQTVLARGPVDVYPTWLCDGDEYQVRYRVADRDASQDAASTGDFGDWMDMRTGSTGNDGWGGVQQANVTDPERSGTRVWSPYGIASEVSATGTDRVDVQFEARRFASSYGPAGAVAHGSSAAFSAKVCYRAELSGMSLTFTPQGLRFSYESDFPRGANSLSVSAQGLFGEHSYQGLPASGYVEVPISDLTGIPEEGSSPIVSVSFSTCDAAMPALSVPLEVSYSGSHGTSVSLDAQVEGSVARLTKTANTRVWLVVPRGHGDRLVEVSSDIAVPPLGEPWRAYALRDNGDGTWASRIYEFPAVEPDGYHLTLPDGSGDFALTMFDGYGGAATTISYEKDSSSSVTTGREREVVGFGSTVKATWSLSGVLAGDGVSEKADAFDRAAHWDYAVYRDPLGFWSQVAVLSATIDRSKVRNMDVSFSLEEVEL